MADDIDKILSDIDLDKKRRTQQEESVRQLLQVDTKTEETLLQQRKDKVSGFKLDVDFGDNQPSAPINPSVQPPVPPREEFGRTAEIATSDLRMKPDAGTAFAKGQEPEQSRQTSKKHTKSLGCGRALLYALLVITSAVVLAFVIIAGALDLTGLNKSSTLVTITLTEKEAASTAKVANILHDAGVIDQPWIFRLYCKLTRADGKFVAQKGAEVSADMGYATIINILKTTVRDIAKVTFPEGMSIADMAKKLEEAQVCTAEEFLSAVNEDYEYDFLQEIPSGDAYKGRKYKLEGYLFPDTYEFYVGSAGRTVVDKFLNAFDSRVNVSMRVAMRAQGMSLNEVITLASLIEWEAADTDDMFGVSRVLHNRLKNPSTYPKLECDSTQRYVRSTGVSGDDYDTYKRKGLPIGPITNPGLTAIEAAMYPSNASNVKNCYFFATDLKTGNTYFSSSLSQHIAICKKYKIGMYA